MKRFEGDRFKQAERTRKIQPPVIPIVAKWVEDNPGTISLGQGVVGWGPPEEAYVEMADVSRNPENHKYKSVQGIAPLLDLVKEKLKKENGIQPASDEDLFITAGSNMGFVNAILAITDPGDEVILPAPFYFNHEMAIDMLGCRPVIVSTKENHQLDLHKLKTAINKKTKAIVTVSPNNPSGAVYPREDLESVTELCREHNLFHISDEAYEYFTFDESRHFSPASAMDAEENVISLFSLSKAYGFASWRIGYQVVPPQISNAIRKIQDTNLICPPVVSQHAAMGCLRKGRSFCDERIRSIAKVRKKVLERISKWSPFANATPAGGAFYLLLKVETDMLPMELTRRLIERHKVAVIPGSAFGLNDSCHLRLAYGVLDLETCEKALTRLERGLQDLVG